MKLVPEGPEGAFLRGGGGGSFRVGIYMKLFKKYSQLLIYLHSERRTMMQG